MGGISFFSERKQQMNEMTIYFILKKIRRQFIYFLVKLLVLFFLTYTHYTRIQEINSKIERSKTELFEINFNYEKFFLHKKRFFHTKIVFNVFEKTFCFRNLFLVLYHSTTTTTKNIRELFHCFGCD